MNPEKLQLQSADGAQINLDMLYQIAPSCFTEARGADGKVRRVVNFDVLRQLLGDATADTGEEFYQFTWPGKAEARREAARSIRKTLRPVPEDSVDWDTTQNIYIEGDNLEVLKLLQKSYMGKVKMIYIDPPYNTGNDFVYKDNFASSSSENNLAEGNTDEYGNRYRKNTDSNGRFHSDWCSMIYPRIQLARTLLAEDGVIFISIGDAEENNLRKICDETFGAPNFIARIVIITGANQAGDGVLIQKNVEYVFAYAKNISTCTINRVDKTEETWRNLNDAPTPLVTRPDMGYTLYYNPNTSDIIPLHDYDKSNLSSNDEHVVYEDNLSLVSKGYIPIRPGKRNGMLHRWRWGIDTFKERIGEIRMFNTKDSYIPKFLQAGYNPPKNYHNFTGGASELKVLFGEQIPFDYPKGIKLLMYLVSIGANSDSIILDFFSGSATTAHAVMKQNAEDGGNRHFIMVQLQEETEEDSEARKAGYENICQIGKERIRRAGRKVKEEAGLHGQDLDIGFRVFRVDDSNMEDVYFQPAALRQQDLNSLFDNVKPDRTDLDLLFGAMLDWGVKLSLPMSKATIDGRDIYTVNEGDLVACFAENITENVIAHIADQSPLRVLFRDSCFNTDADKINIFEQFKQRLNWSDEEAMKNIRVI